METDVDRKIREIAEQRESALVGIILRNLSELKAMDFMRFVLDLRVGTYDIGILDLDQMEGITNALEHHWREAVGSRYQLTRLAKALNLPGTVVYEALSKEFGEDKKPLDILWEGYQSSLLGTDCIYTNGPKAIISSLKDGSRDHLGVFGPIPRVYKGKVLETRQALEMEERLEHQRVAHEFVDAVGDRSRARNLLNRFVKRAVDLDDELEKEGKRLDRGLNVVHDYYNGCTVRNIMIPGRYI